MKDILFNNLALKILSLAFAILLWFFITARGTSEVTFEVPIEYVNIPSGYEIIQKERDKVSVSVSGSERILRSLRPEDLRVVIDLTEGAFGVVSYSIKERNIRVPPAVSISNVSPPSVRVTLDRVIKKDVPVRAVVVNHRKLKEEYTINLNPPDVTIEGPESILKTVQSVKTEPLDLTAIEADTVKKVSLTSEVSKVRILNGIIEVSITKKQLVDR